MKRKISHYFSVTISQYFYAQNEMNQLVSTKYIVAV